MFSLLYVPPNFAMNSNFAMNPNNFIYFTSKVIELHKSQIDQLHRHLAFEKLKTNHAFSL